MNARFPARIETRSNRLAGESMMAARIANGLSALALVAVLVTTGCGTLTGAAVGGAGGAAVGAATGYGAGKGALIGAGVGAVAGAIYDITRHEED
jgi:hypothetical protein